MRPIQARNIALCIVLSIVTCGIYTLYWYFKIAEDVEMSGAQERVGMSPGIIILLHFVTCSLFTVYVNYKYGKALMEMYAQRGMQLEDRSIVYLLLTIFGLDLIAWALIQSDLNRIATYQ